MRAWRRQLGAMLITGLIAQTAYGEWQPDTSDKRQVKAFEGVERVKDQLPKTASFFEQAYGYAVIPSIGRVAIGFGGNPIKSKIDKTMLFIIKYLIIRHISLIN